MVDSTIYAEPTPIVPVAVRGIIVDIEGKDAIKRPVVAATFYMSTTVFTYIPLREMPLKIEV